MKLKDIVKKQEDIDAEGRELTTQQWIDLAQKASDAGMVFALLTLSTVQADGRLSDASLKAATDYYAADTEAETIYAQLRQGTVPTGVKVEGNLYTYQCEISETQTLSVRLQKSEAGWRVLQWKAVSTIEWNTDL